MTEHVTTITQMVSDEPSMLYPTVNDDDDEIDHSDEDYVISIQSESDNNNDGEEEDLEHSYMGSGSTIDDLVDSGTLRLLDWNDSMTDIQLGMRFVEEVQAISARYLSQISSKKCRYYFKWVVRTSGHGHAILGGNDYRNLDSPPRCGRCRMLGHNRKNCNNPGSSNV
ncbi:hypothetical protein M9H77_17356 [Catharanthus roseus]|uniref:Uncharacterized protein n=1 Tax=Catharanthus roseus TaxID=4058 RepID=A0ACC0B4D2_CATRO|nr:hypothetical protein M9H77_17356 [Catharanthus roseus]